MNATAPESVTNQPQQLTDDPASEWGPSWAPLGDRSEKPAKAAFPGDNGWIAFVRELDGNDEIYVQKDEAGSDAIRLTTNPAIEQFPAVSPNGKEMAFISWRDDAVNPNPEGDPEIYVMDANDDDADGNGDDLRRLTYNGTQEGGPAWSPDGKRIAFSSFRADAVNQTPDGDVYVMDANGSEQTNLTNEAPGARTFFDGQPVFSPDGARIAFLSNRDGNNEIYVMNVDGSNPTNLTNNPASDSQPEFSPDGSRIAFTSNRDGDFDIWVMKAEPESATNVPINLTNAMVTNERWPAWSPDGDRIAFWSGIGSGLGPDSEIFVMDANGSGHTNLTNNSASEAWPDWGPAPTKNQESE